MNSVCRRWRRRVFCSVVTDIQLAQQIPLSVSMYRNDRLTLGDRGHLHLSARGHHQGYQEMLEGENLRGIINYTEADR